MTDRVVFSWYVANLGAASSDVCLRAEHSPRKLSKWLPPCNENLAAAETQRRAAHFQTE